MADIDLTGTGPTTGQVPFTGVNRHYVLQNTVDLTGGAITQGDVYQCLAIPANTRVGSVKIFQHTAAVGTTLTMNVGDGGATNGWDASVDGKGTADTWIAQSAVGTDARAAAASQGYFYTSGDSIDVVMTTATSITAGPKFTIFAECTDFNVLPG